MRAALPDPIDPAARDLIYVHGRIVETEGPDAVSPRVGADRFHAIAAALAAAGDAVMAELRPPGGLDDVDTLVDHLGPLPGAGVPAHQITAVGFSKGGYMTLRTAAPMATPALN